MRPVASCAVHKPSFHPLCDTCRRIAVEQDIVTRTVDTLLAAGYALATDEDDHRFYDETNPSRDRETILKSLMETDEEHLGVFAATEATGVLRIAKPFAWIYFVYGNDGWDVISDYTVNLEPVLKPVTDYIDTIAP